MDSLRNCMGLAGGGAGNLWSAACVSPGPGQAPWRPGPPVDPRGEGRGAGETPGDRSWAGQGLQVLMAGAAGPWAEQGPGPGSPGRDSLGQSRWESRPGRRRAGSPLPPLPPSPLPVPPRGPGRRVARGQSRLYLCHQAVPPGTFTPSAALAGCKPSRCQAGAPPGPPRPPGSWLPSLRGSQLPGPAWGGPAGEDRGPGPGCQCRGVGVGVGVAPSSRRPPRPGPRPPRGTSPAHSPTGPHTGEDSHCSPDKGPFVPPRGLGTGRGAGGRPRPNGG